MENSTVSSKDSGEKRGSWMDRVINESGSHYPDRGLRDRKGKEGEKEEK